MKKNGVRCKVGEPVSTKEGLVAILLPGKLTKLEQSVTPGSFITTLKNFAYVEGEFLPIEDYDFIIYKKKRGADANTNG